MAAQGYIVLEGEQARMTAYGEQAIAALWAVLERVQDELLAGFSNQEKDTLFALLRRIQRNAEQLAAQ